MKKLNILFYGLLAICSVSLDAAKRDRVSEMPNVVILLADDLGYGELSCQGNPEIPTPHIDAIAAAGVRFTSGYVSGPNCSPSRAGLLTGRYGTRFGHEFNPTGPRNENTNMGLPLEQKLLPEYLQESGYVNGIIGKWHLGGTAYYNPIRRGFDRFYGFLHEGHYFVPPPWDGTSTWLRRAELPGGGKGQRTFGKRTYTTHMKRKEPDYDADNPILSDGQPVIEEDNLTDAIAREAIDFIEHNKGNPFFLYVPFNAVHSPLQGDDKYMREFKHIENIQRRIFAAMLAQMDDAVGKIMKKLKKEGLLENTMVYFLSDNGGPTRELTSNNLPLRGEKSHMHEGGIRVPFMLQWTGAIPKGIEYDRPVCSTDIFATTFAAAGLEMPKTDKLDSVNILPYIKGRKGDPHETLFWRQGSKAALRKGDMKIVRMGSEWELYNLADDLSEKNDLAKTNPEHLNGLIQEWESQNKEMVEAAFK